MVQKIVTFDVALKSTERQWVQKIPEVYTNDLGSVSLQFRINDCTDTELTGSTAIVLLKMRDGSFFQGPSVDVKRTLNVFSYTLKENEGNHDGLAEIQLIVTIGAKEFATQKYNFKVISGLDSEVAREIMIYDWSTLTAEARAYIDQFTADEVLRDAEFDNDQFDRNVAFNLAQTNRQNQFSDLAEDLTSTLAAADASIGEFDVALETGIIAANLAEKLEGFESTNNSRLLSVESGLAEKVDRGQVSVSDINKNLGKLDQTYLSDTLLQQIAGTTPVNATPADDSITLKKTTFYTVGKNLFDKNAAVSGFYVNHLNGTLVASANYWVSEYILIAPATTYTINKRYWLAFYDADKVFISGVAGAAGAVGTILTPVNAVYVRISVFKTLLSTTQLELGASETAYESHVKKIPTDFLIIPDFDPEDIPDGSVTKAKTDFIIVGKNKFDKTKAVDGYINQENGVLDVTTSYKASDFIDVTPLSAYSFTTGEAVRIAYYTSSKTFIRGTLNPAVPVTTPENCAFVRYSFTQNQLNLQQFEEGVEQTEYQQYGYIIDGGIYKETSLSEQFAVDVVVAPKIPAVVGKELNIYFENILNDKANDYQIDFICSVGQQQNERWTLVPTVAGTYAMTIKIFKKFVQVKQINTSVVIKAASVGNGISKKLLIIGDSTTANSLMANELNNVFTSDVMNLELIGTKGTAPVKHEGISGWTVNHFYTDATSPFVFSGVFDFAQYMSANGFSNTDYVVVNLGINDVFSYSYDGALNTKIAEMLTQYQSIINGIKAFDTNIKIGLGITIPPNGNQDAFGKDYASSQTRFRYKRNNFLWAKALVNAFKDLESQGIYLIPFNSHIDTVNNFDRETVAVNSRNTLQVVRSARNGGVHPALSGYYQIADMYFYWLKSFEV